MTAFERQVQTLAIAVERLTKQTHDLEEQLCQRMRDTATRKKTKKVPVPSDETKKDRRVVTPQVDRSDKM